MQDPNILDAPSLPKKLYSFDGLDTIATFVSILVFGFMTMATVGNIINNGFIFSLLLIVLLFLLAPIRYFLQYYRWTKGLDTVASLENLALFTRPVILLEAVIGIAMVAMFWQELSIFFLIGLAILLNAVVLGVAVVRNIGRVEREGIKIK